MPSNESQPDVTVYTLAERPDLEVALWDLFDLWPLFILGDPTSDLYFERCVERFPDLVLVAEDKNAPGVVAARGFMVPFEPRDTAFPTGGWDTVVRWGIQDLADNKPTTHVSALEITLRPQYRGTGLGVRMIENMKAAARARGAVALVGPVRPTRKAMTPGESMDSYVARTRDDGQPFDPWLRAHVSVGARIVCVAPRSMIVVASLDEWRAWTNAPLDQTGPTEVEGALVPIYVDVERDQATYIEPNVWVIHELS